MKKNTRNTKGKIVSAAWELFYQHGYENTTIEEIVELSGTSKGSFYHYFSCKDDLLSSLSYLFDEKYEELFIEFQDVCPDMPPMEKFLHMNQALFRLLENTITVELLSKLFAAQLITKGERPMLNSSRPYFKLLRKIASEGLANGDFRSDLSVNDIAQMYLLLEHGLMYNWCSHGGNYSICQYSAKVLPILLQGITAQKE